MIKMRRSMKIDGDYVRFSRSLVGWVAVLGEGYAIHIKQVGKVWVVRRPYALEPICTAVTLYGAYRRAKVHYRHLQEESKQRIAAKLLAAAKEVNL